MAQSEFAGLDLPDADEFTGLDLPEADEFQGLDLDFTAPDRTTALPQDTSIPATALRPRPEEAAGRIVPEAAPEERSYLETIGAGLRRGFIGEGVGLGKGIKYVGDVVGSQTVAGLGENLEEYAQGILDEHPEWAPAKEQMDRPWYHPERLAETTAEAIPMMASFMIPGGVAAKGMRLAGATEKAARLTGAFVSSTPFGVVSAGAMYESAQEGLIKEGLSPEDAQAKAKWLAGTAGVLEGLLESYGASQFLKMTGLSKVGKEGIKEFISKTEVLKNVARSAGEMAKIEALEELSQTVKDNVIEKYGFNEGQKIFEGGLQAATVGGILGGMLGASSRAYGELTTPRQKDKAGMPEIQALPKEVAEKIVRDETIPGREAKEVIESFIEQSEGKTAEESALIIDELLAQKGIKKEVVAFDTQADVDTQIEKAVQAPQVTAIPEVEPITVQPVETGESVEDDMKAIVAEQEGVAEEPTPVIPEEEVDPAIPVEAPTITFPGDFNARIFEGDFLTGAALRNKVAKELGEDAQLEMDRALGVANRLKGETKTKWLKRQKDAYKAHIDSIRAEVPTFQEMVGRDYPTLDADEITYLAQQVQEDSHSRGLATKGEAGKAALDTARAWKVFIETGTEAGPRGGRKSFDAGQGVFREKADEYLRQKAAGITPEAEVMDFFEEKARERAEVAPEAAPKETLELAPTEKAKGTTKDRLADFMGKAMSRFAMEQEGEAILEDLEEAEISPQDVSGNFWKQTYFNLPDGVQVKFQRYLTSLTGWKPGRGDVMSFDSKTNKAITADSWVDIAEVLEDDLPGEARYLEDIERGYVVLMHEANKRFQEAKETITPKREALELAPTEKVPVVPRAEEQIGLPIKKGQARFPEAPLKGKEAKEVELIDEAAKRKAEKAQEKILFAKKAAPKKEVLKIMSKADIESEVNPIISKWENGPTVKIVDKVNDLPSELSDIIVKDKKEKDVKGIFLPETKTVYLVAGNIDSLEGAREILFHEAIGHYGVRGLLGKNIDPILNQVYAKYNKEAQAIAKENNIDISTKEGRHLAAQEVLADIAEKNTDPGLIKKVIAAIRNWLRKVGFKLKLSDGDIRKMLADAAQFVAKGEKSLSLTGPPMFAIKKEPTAEPSKESRIEELRAKFAGKKEEPGDAQKIFQDVEAEAKASPSVEPKAVKSDAPALERARSKIGPSITGQSFWGKILNQRERAGLKLRQLVVDRFASIREFSEQGYVLSRMTTSALGALEAFLMDGKIRMAEDGGVTIDETGKGLFSVFKPLGEELELFLEWIAGNRAKNLKAEDRERLFKDDEIEALVNLSEGKMKDGKSRKVVYNKVFRELRDYQNSLVDIAVEAGTISPEARDAWKDDFYVPFYRVLNEDQSVSGPRSLDSLVGQKAFHKLKGADIPLNDLLHNVLMNSQHLIDSAMKNNAARISLRDAENVGVAEKVSEKEKSKKAVFVLEDGKKIWYEISDPLVYDSITALNWEGFNNPAMKAIRKFKRAFTAGVTASPEFRVANLLRDTVHSAAVGKTDYNLLKNVIVGIKGTKKDSLTKAQMLAGGGEIHFGHMHGGDPEAARLLINKGVKKNTILDSKEAIDSFKRGWGAAWDKWQEFGSRMENINRAALYEKRVKEVGHLQASFEARDLMDFTNYGTSTAVRFLIQAVPFLNARLQGLDKMGRAFMDKEQRGQFLAVTGMVSLASMALYLAYKDDEDYQAREEWDKDTYWWFKLPGSDVAYRLPKPFEVGAIGTMAERTLEQIVDDKAHGELFAERLKHMLTQTFAFSAVPQLVQPALDIYANKNPFTKRDIESKHMQNLSPTERKRAWTNKTAIALSKGMDKILWEDAVLSPVQIEHMVKGYLGWVGAQGLLLADTIVTRPLTDAPVKPTKKIDDYPGIGRFIRTNPQRNTKYATMFYEQMEESNRAYNDVRNLRRLKEFEKAKKLQLKTIDKIRWRKYLSGVNRQVINMNKEATLIQRSKTLTAEQKRNRLDLLQRRKNRLMKIAATRVSDKLK
jgi:hypothetical protein